MSTNDGGGINAMPFFSVVIPTYNRAGTLSLSIDSVLAQECVDLEVIIVDNGSTDGTESWLRENYVDPRIRYHYQEGTGSPAGPRNTGMDLACGEWICFLDSDDAWLPGKLAVVKRMLEAHSDADVCCHDLRVVDGHTGLTLKILQSGPASSNIYEDMLREGNRLFTSGTVVRRAFANAYGLRFNGSRDLMVVEDFDLWLRFAHCNARFVFINEILGSYMVTGDNLFYSFEKYCDNLEVLYRRHVFDIQVFTTEKKKLWQSVYSNVAICRARRALVFRDILTFFRMTFLALRYANWGFLKSQARKVRALIKY